MVEKKAKDGYTKTEVGIIPDDWEVIELGNYVTIRSGESPSKFKFFNKGIPYFKVEQLNNCVKYQIKSPTNISVLNPIPKGSIIFPKRGASILLNKVRILNQDSFMDTNLMTVTTNEKVYNEFLYYMLSYLELWKIADTTSVPQINNKHIEPYKIALPSMMEQNLIASSLSEIDNLLQSLEKLIDKKKKIKQGTMQQLLTGKKRLPGFSGEWEVKTLGSITTISRGQLITEKDSINGPIPVIAGGIEPSYYHIKSNRLGKTITISASGANAGYVGFHNQPIFASDCSTISEGAEYNIEFVYYQLKLLQEKIYSLQTGGAQPHIHPKDLIPLVINYTHIAEQNTIAEILLNMDSEIEVLEQKLKKYKKIKQGMMQELLTGRIRLI